MRTIAVTSIALLLASVALAQEQGFLGFSQQVSVSWRFNVDSAVVNHVAPDSPAQKAGIATGDSITEIDGCAIPGCGAYKAKGLMEKKIGETLNLKLKRPNGEEYTATLTAVPRPAPSPTQ